jgi:hypothetical protein
MKDVETQATLARIVDRNFWTLAWFAGGTVTLIVILQIIEEWRKWGSHGKFMAGGLMAFLILFPARLIYDVRKGKPISSGWLVSAAHLMLMIAMFTFEPMSRH